MVEIFTICIILVWTICAVAYKTIFVDNLLILCEDRYNDCHHPAKQMLIFSICYIIWPVLTMMYIGYKLGLYLRDKV